MSLTRLATLFVLLVLMLAAAGCTTPPPADAPAPPPQVTEPVTAAHGSVITRNERFVVYLPRADDTLATVAREFLGNDRRAWEIAHFNDIKNTSPGQAIVIPLRPVNAFGISAKGYQTVPILCYHRVGPRANFMIMPPETFAAQMEYLARNNYNVIRLADLADFLSGKRPLPPRAVVITFDDGHRILWPTALMDDGEITWKFLIAFTHRGLGITFFINHQVPRPVGDLVRHGDKIPTADMGYQCSGPDGLQGGNILAAKGAGGIHLQDRPDAGILRAQPRDGNAADMVRPSGLELFQESHRIQKPDGMGRP